MSTFNGMQLSYDNGATWKEIYAASGAQQFVQLGPLVKPFRRMLYWRNLTNSNKVCSSNDGALTIYNSGGYDFSLTGTPSDWGGVLSLAASPVDALTCYAALKYKATTDGYGAVVYKTADGGKTWTLLPLTPDTGFFDSGVFKLAIDPLNPNNVYAMFGSGNNPGGNSRVGVAKSSDAGASWSFVEGTYSGASGGGAPYIGPRDIAVSGNAAIITVSKENGGHPPFESLKEVGGAYFYPEDPARSYRIATTKRGLFAAITYTDTPVQVLWSAGGASWAEASSGALPVSVQHVEFGYDMTSIFVDISFPNGTSTDRGLYISKDAGASFTQKYSDSGGLWSGWTLPDPLNPKYIWHCGDIESGNEDGIFVSKDDGATWLPRRVNDAAPPFTIGSAPPEN